jgi:DNA-binding transcriptional LysR family regulator
MHAMHLRALDLNLVPILQILVETRSVSLAAKRLGLSQSATSHALGRLRDLLRDPLLVRAGRALVPTPRALAALEPIAGGLSLIEQGLRSPEPFSAKTAARSFRVLSGDYAEIVLVPPLVQYLRTEAPRVDLWFQPVVPDAFASLGRQEVDVVIGLASQVGKEHAGLKYAPLINDHFVSLVRKGHPLTRGKMTVKRFADASHLFVAPGGKPGGPVDTALAERGLSRRVALAVPHFVVAPYVVAATDLVLTVGRRLAQALAKSANVHVFETPLTLPAFEIGMYWHVRSDLDPAHLYLRAALQAAARGKERTRKEA